MRRAFTLTELMVAVAVLVVVVFATGKIFGTASKVTSVGMAASDVLQEAAAIERQIRADFARLSRDGVLLIRSNRVPNDINGGGQLLNPTLSPNAFVRSDQVVFFTKGVASQQTLRIDQRLNNKAQAVSARVYYGHLIQLANAQPVDIQGSGGQVRAHDPVVSFPPITPWYDSFTQGNVSMQWTHYRSNNTNPFQVQLSTSIDGTQPEARQWLLGRQAAMLADDDNGAPNQESKAIYMNTAVSARSVLLEDNWAGVNGHPLLHGRVDTAATQLTAIRNAIEVAGDALVPRQNYAGSNLIYFPRGERYAPSSHRVDQALTNHIIGSACSSFIVEWTYEQGIGASVDATGVVYDGLFVDSRAEHPWFGMNDAQRGVTTYANYVTNVEPQNVPTINPLHIEPEPGTPWESYDAFFLYNQSLPVNPDTGDPWPNNHVFAYTPWPTAIRITMVLHDPATNLESGREFQFVIKLPGETG